MKMIELKNELKKISEIPTDVLAHRLDVSFAAAKRVQAEIKKIAR